MTTASLTRSAWLYAASAAAPKGRGLEVARRALNEAYFDADDVRRERAGTRPTGPVSRAAALTDDVLVALVRAARIVEVSKRSHRACALYLDTIGYGNDLAIESARRQHRDARVVLALLEGERTARLARYATAIKLLKKGRGRDRRIAAQHEQEER